MNEENQDMVDDIDVGFDIEDRKDIHDQHEMHQLTQREMELAAKAHEQQRAMYAPQTVRLESIMKKEKGSYVYGGSGFDVYQGKEVYSSTMLRFSGVTPLREEHESDKQRVRNIMVKEMKFNAEQIENVQIRNGRAWCIVYVRAPIKFITDRIKKQQAKNQRIYTRNRQIRQKIINKARRRTDDDEEEDSDSDMDMKPIYRVNEYVRRPNANDINADAQNANPKLYVLNFDILNKNTHKALTNLFCKFGDLARDIQVGINSREDPYAKVEYKDINDAKAVWSYQNVNGDPKVQFGKRTLTIQYAKY